MLSCDNYKLEVICGRKKTCRRMSTNAGSLDSSSSFVEIDSENTSSSAGGGLLDEDTKPNINGLLPPSRPTSPIAPLSIGDYSSNNSRHPSFGSAAGMGGISIPHHHAGLSAAFHGYHGQHTANGSNKGSSPFLLPAQLYKSLFASAVLQNPDQLCQPHFPRNLLFSCSDRSPAGSEADIEEKCVLADEVMLPSTFLLYFRFIYSLW